MSKNLEISDLIPKRLPKLEISGEGSLDKVIHFKSIELRNVSGIQSLIKDAINKATIEVAKDLKIALDAAIRSSSWDGLQGPSDIYDTGELLNSGEVVADSSGITVYYTAPYAALVHYGGYINPYGNINARVYLPPRPWVESVLFGGGPVPQFDFKQYYQRALDQAFA
jgi:hypothetical protein